MSAARRIIIGTVAVLSLTAISASGAAAMSIYGQGTALAPGHHASVPYTKVAPPAYSRQDKQVVRPATPSSAPAAPAARAPRFTAPSSGFSLTDGAITAGGVIALLALALGSGLAVSRRRAHRAALSQ